MTGRASCWPSAARTYLNHYGVAVGRNVGVYTANDSAYAAALDLKKAGVDIAAIVDLRDNPSGRWSDAGACARHRDQSGPRRDPHRRQAARLVDDHPGRRTAAPSAPFRSMRCWSRPAGRRRSICSRSRAARSPSTMRRKRFLPGTYAQDCVSRRRLRGRRFSLEASHRRGVRGRREGGARRLAPRRFKPAKIKVEAARDLDRHDAGQRPGRRRRHDGQGLRRFPERRDRQGHPARRARGHALDRARQALHHQRHGDRPGQDVEHARAGDRRRDAGQGDPGGRPHHLPRALHAGHLRRHRRPCARAAVRSDAAHRRSIPRPRSSAPCSRMSGSGSAPGISREAGEDMHAAVNRECKTVRQAGRPVRRLDARQDRGGRAGCGEVHGTALHQPVGEARRRPLPLWHHAARGRLHL